MNEKLIIPGSIIIAGAIIAFALYSSNTKTAEVPPADNNPAQQQQERPTQEVSLTKVSQETDHIMGNTNADLFVVEYSDLECPFCKRYHDETLSRLKSDYENDDRVAFVFRHFPLDVPYTQQALHPTAQEEHIAAECVAKLGGNDAFFDFVDAVFAKNMSKDLNELSLELSTLAVELGINQSAFDTCYANQDTESIVRASFDNGLAAGVQGTPTVFIQTKDGTTFRAEADYNVIKTSLSAYLSDLQ